jgi:lipopolysaccharide export system protein LptA
MRLKSLALCFTMLVICAPGAYAFTGTESSDEPIHVVADALEVDNKANVAVFMGAVKATQGDVVITSDKLRVYYERSEEDAGEKKKEPVGGMMDSGGKVRKVVAQGHVKITQKDRVAVGRKATYWAGGRKMLLEGKATVWRGKNQVSGEKITVFMDENRSVVHGKPGKRVSVTITPKKKK